MTFSEYDELLVWRCDTCGLTAKCPQAQGFGTSWNELKKAYGWRATRDGDWEDASWSHHCGRCYRAAQQKIAAELFGGKDMAELFGGKREDEMRAMMRQREGDETMSIEQWQDHFRAEAKRILKQFERTDPIIEPETVEDIEALYAGMPEQLRQIVDEVYGDERHPGKLLIEMMQVELATSKVLARKGMQ